MAAARNVYAVRRYRPAVAAAVVFVAGFGVMSSFAALGTFPDDVPGHLDYLSGTVGDAVALPVLLGLLTTLRYRLEAGAAGTPTRGWCGAVIGSVAGATVQASWLADPHASPNWTLPEAHVFSAAGWYHAVFFVAVSAWVGALLWRTTELLTSHRGRALPPGTLRLLSAVFGVAAWFLGMVATDSLPSASTAASLATMAASAAAVLSGAVVLGVAARRATALQATMIGTGAGALIAVVTGILWRLR